MSADIYLFVFRRRAFHLSRVVNSQRDTAARRRGIVVDDGATPSRRLSRSGEDVLVWRMTYTHSPRKPVLTNEALVASEQ